MTLADDDRNSKEVDFVRLQASRACYVYILRDPRGTVAQGGKLPLWLSTSFVQTKEVVRTSMPGMQVLSVYRSKAPLWGPIVLGGNDAFPSHGARENFVIVLKAARMENVFHAPADVSSSWPPQPCSWCKSCCDHAPSRDDVIPSAAGAAASGTSAGAGAAGETAAHTAAAGHRVPRVHACLHGAVQDGRHRLLPLFCESVGRGIFALSSARSVFESMQTCRVCSIQRGGGGGNWVQHGMRAWPMRCA